MGKYFLYSWGWFEFKTPWHMKTIWMLIFILLRAILYSLNGLCLEVFSCICSWVIYYQVCIYWKREYLYSCVSSPNFLKFGLCFFIFPHILNFPKNVFPKTCFVFPIFIGGESCFQNLYSMFWSWFANIIQIEVLIH